MTTKETKELFASKFWLGLAILAAFIALIVLWQVDLSLGQHVLVTIGYLLFVFLVYGYLRARNSSEEVLLLAPVSASIGLIFFVLTVGVETAYFDVQTQYQAPPPTVGEHISVQRTEGRRVVVKHVDGVHVYSRDQSDPLVMLAFLLLAGGFISFALGFAALGTHRESASNHSAKVT